MKIIIKFLLILIFSLFNVAKAQMIKVTGQLIEYTEDKIPAYCGYQIEYGILKIKLENDVSHFKAEDTILIFQTCPRETMEREVGHYSNGKKYLLEIGKELSKSDLTKATDVLK